MLVITNIIRHNSINCNENSDQKFQNLKECDFIL